MKKVFLIYILAISSLTFSKPSKFKNTIKNKQKKCSISITSNDLEYAAEVLSSKQLFENLTCKWKFKNRNEKYTELPIIGRELDLNIKRHMHLFIKKTLRKGLFKLLRVNPQIFMKSIPLLNKKIEFVSVFFNTGGSPAYVVHFPGMRNTVYLKDTVIDVIASKFNSKKYSEMELKHYGFQSQKIPIKAAQNIIFHEFLHLMGVDNLTRDEHNNSVKLFQAKGIIVDPAHREKDLVIACSNLIYPENYGFINNYLIKPYYSKTKKRTINMSPNTYESCNACYSAFRNESNEKETICNRYKHDLEYKKVLRKLRIK